MPLKAKMPPTQTSTAALTHTMLKRAPEVLLVEAAGAREAVDDAETPSDGAGTGIGTGAAGVTGCVTTGGVPRRIEGCEPLGAAVSPIASEFDTSIDGVATSASCGAAGTDAAGERVMGSPVNSFT